jgi:hypothetical protein
MVRTRKKITYVLVIILILCTSLFIIFDIEDTYAESAPGDNNTEENCQSVTKFVFVEVEKTVTVPGPVKTIYITKPYYIQNTISVPYEVTVTLKDWDSVEQLREFLENDLTDQHIALTTDNTGTVKLYGQCEDYALQLRDNAMVAGMYLSVQILHPEEYKKYYPDKESNSYHAICMARIGNEFWYIEPSSDECWLAFYLD